MALEHEIPYGGIATFCKFPHTRELAGADAAVIGIPQDQATTNRPGARFGPRAIRDASQIYGAVRDSELGLYDIELGRHILGGVKVVDFGDVPIAPTMTELNNDLITMTCAHVLESEVFPLTLGGDHSVVFPILRAFEGVELDVVHFDTHLDFMDDILDLGLKYTHGNPLKRISELDHVGEITQIGIRGFESPRYVHDEALAYGSNVICAREAIEEGPEWVLGKVPEARSIYVTIDIDALDPSVAPGTGTPEPGGFSYLQLRSLLQGLPAKGNIVGFDIVEVSPPYDHSELTSMVAARLALDFLGAIFELKSRS